MFKTNKYIKNDIVFQSTNPLNQEKKINVKQEFEFIQNGFYAVFGECDEGNEFTGNLRGR